MPPTKTVAKKAPGLRERQIKKKTKTKEKGGDYDDDSEEELEGVKFPAKINKEEFKNISGRKLSKAAMAEVHKG